MTEINYVTGDATSPFGGGNSKKIIVHVCNNVEGRGAWGAGFVMALSKKWKAPEATYRGMKHRDLGEYILTPVEDDIDVCNLIGQEGTIKSNVTLNMPPIRYVAIETALKKLAMELIGGDYTVHMPRIGSGLAGGNWKIIETIIEETLCKAGVSVTVYDLP